MNCSSKRDRVSHTTEMLIDFIEEIVRKSINEGSPDVYKLFIKNKITKEDAIITTNWDTLLDDKIKSKLNKGEFHYSKRPNLNPSIKSIPLLKLHGSLNWVVHIPHIQFFQGQ